MIDLSDWSWETLLRLPGNLQMLTCHTPPAVTALELCMCKTICSLCVCVCVCVALWWGRVTVPGAKARNMAFQFFHFSTGMCVCYGLSLHSCNKISLQSSGIFWPARLCAAFVSLALLVLVLRFNSAVPPIKPSPEPPFPDSVPECPRGVPVSPSNHLSLNQVWSGY